MIKYICRYLSIELFGLANWIEGVAAPGVAGVVDDIGVWLGAMAGETEEQIHLLYERRRRY